MSLLDDLPDRCKIQHRSRSNDDLGGNRETRIVDQTAVECWEQQASASQINQFDKRGITIDRKVFFKENPNVTEGHEIVITSKGGIALSESEQIILDVHAEARPDASAGLGWLYRVMCNEMTGERV